MTKQQSTRVWVAVDPEGYPVVSAIDFDQSWVCHQVSLREVEHWAALYRRGWRIKRARVVVEG